MYANRVGASRPAPKPIVVFLPILSAKKPPAKFAVIIAKLPMDAMSPMKNAKASLVPVRSFSKNGTGEADTIELAKVVKKIVIKRRIKLRDSRLLEFAC